MATALGWTNRGMYNILAAIFNGVSLPTNFYLALMTDATAFARRINLMSDMTEIAAGNGYTTGGYQLTKDSTDFPNIDEIETGSEGDDDYAIIDLKDITWTASGGNLPGSGDGARYAVLTDDNGTVANREIWAGWDLSSARTVSNGQDLTVHAAQLLLFTYGTVI